MAPTLLLFDIDGTILLARGAGSRAMVRAGRRVFHDQFSFEVHTAGQLDPAIYVEAALANGLEDFDQHHEVFHDHYIVELEADLARTRHDVLVMPGIRELILELHQRASTQGDIILGLLTGNYTRAVPIKLSAIDMDPGLFSITAFGDEGRIRSDLTALAMRKYEALVGETCDPRRVIIIGDTPRDVECAKAHHCRALAVATGHYSIEELEACGPDLALPDLSDPAPFYDLITRTRQPA